MSTLGQWFFEREKASIMAALQQRAPYTAIVSTVDYTGRTVTIVDPFTGEHELERLAIVGGTPVVNDTVLVTTLVDGSRVANGLRPSFVGSNDLSVQLGPPHPDFLTPAGDRSVAIGLAGTVDNAVAVGVFASAGAGSVAVGKNADAWAAGVANESVALGAFAVVNALRGVALGRAAVVEANAPYGMAMGYGALARGDSNIAIGRSASTANVSSGTGETAIGQSATVTDELGTAIGQNAAAANRSTAVGSYAKGTGNNAVAVGHYAGMGGTGVASTAVGTAANARGTDSIAVGKDASVATGTVGGIALGKGATVTHSNSFAFGAGAASLGTDWAYMRATRLYVYVGTGNSGLVLASPDGSKWIILVSNTGVITATKL